MVRLLIPSGVASGVIAAWIWLASSRVGARMSARGLRDWRVVLLATSRVSIGSRNA